MNETDYELLRKPELSKRLAISVRTLDGWMASRRIPFIRVGKVVRFVWPDVLSALKARGDQNRREA